MIIKTLSRIKNEEKDNNVICSLGLFIKIAPENPVLWTGMKGVSAKGRKNVI